MIKKLLDSDSMFIFSATLTTLVLGSIGAVAFLIEVFHSFLPGMVASFLGLWLLLFTLISLGCWLGKN